MAGKTSQLSNSVNKNAPRLVALGRELKLKQKVNLFLCYIYALRESRLR